MKAEQAKCYVIDVRKLPQSVAKKIVSRGTLVKCAGLTLVIFAGLETSAFAADTGIDIGARKLYSRLMNVAKWVIAFKGGIETLKNMADGDHLAVKKNALGYGLTFFILLALPWGLDQIQILFEEAQRGTAQQ